MSTLTSPTLQGLTTDVRKLLNQLDPLNSFWKDDEICDYLNEGIRMYFLEVVQSAPGYFTTTADLNIVSGTETIALPSDFFEMVRCYKKVSNGYRMLSYRNDVTSSYTTNLGNSAESYEPYYFFRSSNLVLRPGPGFSETAGIRIEYVQFPDTMVYGGDSMTGQVSPIFKQLIVMYGVYKAKLKESMVNGVNVHSVPKENLSEIYGLFKDAVAQRSKFPTFIQVFDPESGGF